jgi:hypothetical protein
MLKQSSTDSMEPSFIFEKAETWLPSLLAPLKERAEPKPIWSITEHVAPRASVPKTLVRLPNLLAALRDSVLLR